MSNDNPPSAHAWLQRLGTSVGLDPGPELAAFTDAFRASLEHFTEVGVQLEPAALACLTLGQGPKFGEQVAAFLADRGYGPDAADMVHLLQRRVDDWMLLGLSEGADSAPEVGLYFRRSIGLEQALGWLDERGVTPSDVASLRRLARLIGASRTGIFAVRLRRDEPLLHNVYLRAAPDGSPFEAAHLAPVFRDFQLTPDRWQPLLDELEAAGKHAASDVFISVTVGDGGAFDSLKLDVFHVEIPALERLLGSIGVAMKSHGTPRHLARELGVDVAAHCSLRFRRDEAPRVRIYMVPPDGD